MDLVKKLTLILTAVTVSTNLASLDGLLAVEYQLVAVERNGGDAFLVSEHASVVLADAQTLHRVAMAPEHKVHRAVVDRPLPQRPVHGGREHRPAAAQEAGVRDDPAPDPVAGVVLAVRDGSARVRVRIDAKQ